MGLDFPRERFLLTPIRTLRSILSYIYKREQQRANEYSRTTAKLTWLVHTYMHLQGQQPPPDTTELDYLPFPNIDREDEEPLLEPETKTILIHLLKTLQVPPHIYKILTNPPSTKNPPP